LPSKAPIGIFDSGAGGISILKNAVSILPHEDFIYYGDTKNMPYGDKTETHVRMLVHDAAEYLRSLGVKALVIACNTATGAAAEMLRCRYDIPIIGMEPALKSAASLRKFGINLVMATTLTINSSKYTKLYNAYGQNTVSVPCPGLMEFVERLQLDGDELKLYLASIFKPFLNTKIDAVVLGCTHYVFLRKAIIAALPDDTAVIDGNTGTVNELQRRLAAGCLLNNTTAQGNISIFSSGGKQSVALMENLLARNIE
jgi:glutamate racemase